MARRTPAGLLQTIDRPVFTTREAAYLRETTVSAATKMLARLADDGVVVRANRGVWYVPSDQRFTPHRLIPFLAGGHAAYLSFLSAMRFHGLVEQIPHVVHVATTAHTHTTPTPVAEFLFHQLAPAFFAGYEWEKPNHAFLVATPEKALVDSLYLSGRKGRRFRFLPELELPTSFRIGRARHWAELIPSAPLRTYVKEHLEVVWAERRANAVSRSAV